MQAYEEIEVGGLQVNDVSTFRVDQMPCGGVKDSCSGREGPMYAIEEMTEPKLLVMNLQTGKKWVGKRIFPAIGCNRGS